MTLSEIIQLKYKLENEWLKEQSIFYEIMWVTTTINRCLRSGFGFIGAKRIDKDFIRSLSDSDRAILKKVSDWIEAQ